MPFFQEPRKSRKRNLLKSKQILCVFQNLLGPIMTKIYRYIFNFTFSKIYYKFVAKNFLYVYKERFQEIYNCFQEFNYLQRPTLPKNPASQHVSATTKNNIKQDKKLSQNFYVTFLSNISFHIRFSRMDAPKNSRIYSK